MKTNSMLTLAALLCLGLGSVESFSGRSCPANLYFTLSLSHSQSQRWRQSYDMNNCTKGYSRCCRQNVCINESSPAVKYGAWVWGPVWPQVEHGVSFRLWLLNILPLQVTKPVTSVPVVWYDPWTHTSAVVHYWSRRWQHVRASYQ